MTHDLWRSVMTTTVTARRTGRRSQGSRRGMAAGRDQAGQSAAREISRRRSRLHAWRRADRDEGAIHRQRHQGSVSLSGDAAEETRIRLYGKTAVLWGLVDVTPAKGETYRTRTLEVYTQHANGTLADDAEGIGQGSDEIAIRIGRLEDWEIGRLRNLQCLGRRNVASSSDSV